MKRHSYDIGFTIVRQDSDKRITSHTIVEDCMDEVEAILEARNNIDKMFDYDNFIVNYVEEVVSVQFNPKY